PKFVSVVVAKSSELINFEPFTSIFALRLSFTAHSNLFASFLFENSNNQTRLSGCIMFTSDVVRPFSRTTSARASLKSVEESLDNKQQKVRDEYELQTMRDSAENNTV